jgi:hypothetical protein
MKINWWKQVLWYSYIKVFEGKMCYYCTSKYHMTFLKYISTNYSLCTLYSIVRVYVTMINISTYLNLNTPSSATCSWAWTATPSPWTTMDTSSTTLTSGPWYVLLNIPPHESLTAGQKNHRETIHREEIPGSSIVLGSWKCIRNRGI